LVPTPSDFGIRGQPPTHPQLLDWLATRFIESGWSIKQMHRLMMNTKVYQLASIERGFLDGDPTSQIAEADRVDPNNTLLWRYQRHRLDAESLRDSLLALSGQLDLSAMNEPHPFPPVDQWEFTQHHPFRDCYENNRRSVYLMTARLNARPYFTSFDGADRNASTATRDSSVTTVQTLYLLNNEFVHQQAEGFAARLIQESSIDDARVQRAFELATGRPPSSEERIAASKFLAQLSERLEPTVASEAELEQAAWAGLARALFRTNAFLYVD
jgi:hypothetical protein